MNRFFHLPLLRSRGRFFVTRRWRRKIFVDVEPITKENIEKVVSEVLKTHALNSEEIKYLMDYEKGITPIRNRIKSDRKDVDYHINENHATEIKTFKVGYVFQAR